MCASPPDSAAMGKKITTLRNLLQLHCVTVVFCFVACCSTISVKVKFVHNTQLLSLPTQVV